MIISDNIVHYTVKYMTSKYTTHNKVQYSTLHYTVKYITSIYTTLNKVHAICNNTVCTTL